MLCALGVRPRVVLLQRLISLGPRPEYSPKLLARLHGAVTGMLAAGGGAELAEEAPGLHAGGSGSGDTLLEAAPSAAPWDAPAPLDVGSSPGSYDSFVDAARSALGADDAQLAPPGSSGGGSSGSADDEAGAGVGDGRMLGLAAALLSADEVEAELGEEEC